MIDMAADIFLPRASEGATRREGESECQAKLEIPAIWFIPLASLCADEIFNRHNAADIGENIDKSPTPMLRFVKAP
jgi:hypothetical protein